MAQGHTAKKPWTLHWDPVSRIRVYTLNCHTLQPQETSVCLVKGVNELTEALGRGRRLSIAPRVRSWPEPMLLAA